MSTDQSLMQSCTGLGNMVGKDSISLGSSTVQFARSDFSTRPCMPATSKLATVEGKLIPNTHATALREAGLA